MTGNLFARVISDRPLGWALCLYAAHAFISLAYEMLWIKHLTLTLGMSLATFGIVLAVFILGTGVGGYGIAFIARRQPLSIRAGFAGIQVALGLIGIGLPWVITASPQLYEAVTQESGEAIHLFAQFGVAALIFPPAVLMGAAFPLLTEVWKTRSQDVPLRGCGTLYFVGLIASGLGALLPLLTIPRFGLTGSGTLLGIANLLIGVAALGLKESPHLADHQSAPALQSTSTPIPIKTLFGLGGLIGFLLLGMEVIGARYLWLIANATPYAEGLVVSVVLLSMAVGAQFAVVGLRRGFSPIRLCATGIAGAAVYPLLLILFSADIARGFDVLLHHIPGSETRFLMAHAALAAVVVGCPAFAYGVALSALLEQTDLKNKSSADTIGRFWAWHNWGAMLGTLSVTFFFVPKSGLTLSLAGISALGVIAIGFMIVPRATRLPRVGSRVGSRVALTGVLVASVLLALWIGLSGDLTFRHDSAGDDRKVIFHHEDGLGLVEVLEDKVTGDRFLFSNRLKQEGATRPNDLTVQRIQGYLPILLHEHPRNILVVGLGTGISLGPMIREDVERVTVVEISRGILDAAPLFATTQGPILAHQKVIQIEDDGRNFLRFSRERYDLIVQDLFFPYLSGVGTLYTLEHYKRGRDRLAPGGMMAQWISLKQVGNKGLRSLIRTFHEVFPHTTVWLNGSTLLLLGGLDPLQIRLPEFIARHGAADQLGGVSRFAQDPFDFLGRFVSSGSALKGWAATAPLNTEETSFIEYDTPRRFKTLNSITLAIENLKPLIRFHQPLTQIVSPSSKEARVKLDRVTQASRFFLQGMVSMGAGDIKLTRELYEKSYALNPSNSQVRSFLAHDWETRGRKAFLDGRLDEALTYYEKILLLNPANPEALENLRNVRAEKKAHPSAADRHKVEKSGR